MRPPRHGLSPSREHDEVRNRVVAASTRTFSASHACRWQCRTLPTAICECRPRCPSPSSAAAAAAGARSCAATTSPRASSRARSAAHADQTHQAAHGHRVPRRRPHSPAPRGQPGEHARDLSAVNAEPILHLGATAGPLAGRWGSGCTQGVVVELAAARQGDRRLHGRFGAGLERVPVPVRSDDPSLTRPRRSARCPTSVAGTCSSWRLS
jgi:hypothetical protein